MNKLTKKNKININNLNEVLLSSIFKYLEFQDILKVSICSTLFKNIVNFKDRINSEINLIKNIHNKVDYNILKIDCLIFYEKILIPRYFNNDFLKYTTNIFLKNQIIELDIASLDSSDNCLNIFKLITESSANSIKSLILPLIIFVKDNLLTVFTNLIDLKIKVYYMHDIKENYIYYLVKNLTKIYNQLTMLSLNGLKNIDSLLIDNLEMNYNISKSKLRYIDLSESSIKLDNLNNFIDANKYNLQTLKIDGEYCSQFSIIQEIPKLINIKELSIIYCEDLEDSIIKALIKLNKQYNIKKIKYITNNIDYGFSNSKNTELNNISNNNNNCLNKDNNNNTYYIINKQLISLTLRKMRDATILALELLFTNNIFDNLKYIDLFDCSNFNDICMINLCKNSLKLEYVDVSWNYKLTNYSMLIAFKSLLNLREIRLQGCKNLTNDVLLRILDYYKIENHSNSNIKLNSNNYNKKISSFESLHTIDFSKCDLITDSTMLLIKSKFKNISFYNYYNDYL